jgi:hypothetical protein
MTPYLNLTFLDWRKMMLLPALSRWRRTRPSSRVFYFAALLFVLAFSLAACGRMQSAAPSEDDGYAVTMVSDPETPSVGKGILTFTLHDPTGAPMDRATLTVVGNMSHAGMVPVTGVVETIAGDAYRVAMDWSMAGDWYVDATFKTPDGAEVARRFPIRVN